MPPQTAIDFAWSDLLSRTKVLFTGLLNQYPWNLIPRLGETNVEENPDADWQQVETDERRATQIAQSILLVVSICNDDTRFDSRSLQAWLKSVSQPTCRQIFDIVFNPCGREAATVVSAAHVMAAELSASANRKQASRGPSDLTERILSLTSPGTRRKAGVYFTHKDVARFVVRRVNEALRKTERFSCGISGLSSESVVDHRCNIFDPSVGSGVFLVAAIELAMENVPASQRNQWLQENMLPRVFGCDVLLPSLVSTHLNIARLLLDSRFQFDVNSDRTSRLNLVLENSLADLNEPSVESSSENTSNESASNDEASNGKATNSVAIELKTIEQQFAYRVLRQTPMHAVIGNPPFASRSSNHGQWIRNLVAGDRKPQSTDNEVNYLEIAGQRLSERKIWLHDDYVKFFRYAQWLVDQEDVGTIGFVSNRGFINNTTFRGMRFQLLDNFDSIEIVDLNGDTRNRNGVRSDSSTIVDDNIFPIETGVSISVLSKSGRESSSNQVSYTSLRGSADDKIEQLRLDLPEPLPQTLLPRSPHYFFDPRDENRRAEYENGIPISEAMPNSWSAPVTARDSFVVDFSRSNLARRIEAFCDPDASDELIRAEYFSRTRSSRYPRGDSRSWKLSKARAAVATEDRESAIREFLYRPFDRRWIYWSPTMIDWPRTGLAELFAIPGNIALIARRQSPPDHEPNFFFVTDQLTVDGILRSDNRGNETIFPLFVRTDVSNPDSIRANLSQHFAETVRQRWSDDFFDIRTEAFPASNAATELSAARNLLNYCYALFYATEFRGRFSAQICIEFPRVHLVRDSKLARLLSDAGGRLMDVHLQMPGSESENASDGKDRNTILQNIPRLEIAAGFPKFEGSSIKISEASQIDNISQKVWEYRIGKHQVARKWLKDRRQVGLTDNCLVNYRSALEKIKKTIDIRSEIDKLFAEAGGWEAAF